MHPASKCSLSALDPCSDSHPLGVSAVLLDAPPALISGSPIFLLFQTGIRFSYNFFLISRRLKFNCIAFVHHFLLNSCSALFGVVQLQHNLGILQCVHTCPECSGASTVFSHVCHLPTHYFAGLLAPDVCSFLSHSTDCQHTNSRIASPKHYRPQGVSHNVFSLLLIASAEGIHRCGQACRQKIIASISCSTWLHPLSGFAPSQCSPCPRVFVHQWERECFIIWCIKLNAENFVMPFMMTSPLLDHESSLKSPSLISSSSHSASSQSFKLARHVRCFEHLVAEAGMSRLYSCHQRHRVEEAV